MSFKKLGDNQRRRALWHWLQGADEIPGFALTIAFDKALGSLFAGPAPLDLSNPDFDAYRHWRKKPLEKAFRLAHYLGLLLSGLAYPGQDVWWFTDEDEIAANPKRLRDLTNLCAWVLSGYLPFDLRHLRCGTTRSDDGSHFLEDLASIPDLLAGALAELLARKKRGAALLWNGDRWGAEDQSEKSRRVLWWSAESRQPLKRHFCVVEPAPDGFCRTSVLRMWQDDKTAYRPAVEQ